MSAWAKPGVKCVCVDNHTFERPRQDWCDAPPPMGEVVMVAGVTPDGRIMIEGYPNRMKMSRVDVGWYAWRFRPLVTKTQEQDVAKFRHLLTPSTIDAGLVPAGVELVE